MSKTLRTKSEAIKYLAGMGHVACDRIEELETELAKARADADHWKSECDALQRMVHEVRAEIERLKLTTGELTGAFNARPKCEKCERKDQLIEQMRKALRAWTRTPNIPLHEAIKITNAALEAAERGE